jgi:hypothetical protein
LKSQYDSPIQLGAKVLAKHRNTFISLSYETSVIVPAVEMRKSHIRKFNIHVTLKNYSLAD